MEGELYKSGILPESGKTLGSSDNCEESTKFRKKREDQLLNYSSKEQGAMSLVSACG
jgi:hypothetical protein